MLKTHYQKFLTIPDISTKKSAPVTTNFAKGINTYKPNDTMEDTALRLAQNARFDRIGEYKTRKGATRITTPVGKEALYQHAAVVNNYVNIDELTEEACTFTLPTREHGVICSLRFRVQALDDEYGVLRIRLKTSKNSKTVLATACVDPASVRTTSRDIEVHFNQAPDATRTKLYVEITRQSGTREFAVAMAEDGKLSCTFYAASKGKITSIFEANLSDSTGKITDRSVVFSFADESNGEGVETIYLRKEDGALRQLTKFKTCGNPIRFSQDASSIRCAFGDSPYALTPTDLEEIGWRVSKITTTDLETDVDLEIKVSNILSGTQDNLMYFDASTNTQMVWTYPYGASYEDEVINSYDKFDRDFRQNFPTINSGDPLTAMFVLSGITFVLTRRHKYQMMSDTVESWTQSSCAADHGAFSQEAVACGANYAYFANDEGIYAFDGYTESSITKNTIQNVYDAIENKEKIRLETYNNRLYVLCPPTPAAPGTCLVYNMNLGLWESFDTDNYLSAFSARRNNRFIGGHARMGCLVYLEYEENNYDDLGAPIRFELDTAYQHYDYPGQVKRITKWRPEFARTENPYFVECGYALDFSEEVKYVFSIDLLTKKKAERDYLWDIPEDFGVKTEQTRITTTPKVHGQFYRLQLRYQHPAAFEPVSFRAHTLTIETQRIR